MKKIALLIFFMHALPAYSQAFFEDFCFNSGGNKPTRFNLRIYNDARSKWSGAFVKYEKSNSPISLVLAYRQIDELDKNRPSQTTETWLEISGNKISGEYEMLSQGTNVYSMTYINNSTHKKYYFNLDPNIAPSAEGGCKW